MKDKDWSESQSKEVVMKCKTTTREILIEVETVRVTRKRTIAKKPPPEKKPGAQVDVCGCAEAFAKSGNRLEHLFDKLF